MGEQGHYHFIGIGGIGMSALAYILLQKGYKVSGSDLSTSLSIDQLKVAGATVFKGHAAENVTPQMTVIYSSDIVGKDNPEYMRARDLKVPLLHRSEMLGRLMQSSSPLLVAGTHGKTTTSSLLAHVLHVCGLDPTFAIGGIVKSLGGNGGYGKGPYFVAEADESDGSFLHYAGFGAILTNIDNDHMNHWKTKEQLLKGFQQFADHIHSKEHFFWCADDEHLNQLQLEGFSYGFDPKADLTIKSYHQTDWKCHFDFSFQQQDYLDVIVPLVGAHNVLNGAAIFGLCLTLNIPEAAIRAALCSFQGIGRRAEKKGEKNDISFYDDYAHHPTEIFATLHAIKAAIGPRRLVVAFQPHRYTRTQECLDQFATSFNVVSELLITDIYAAGEKPIDGVSAALLLEKIKTKTKIEANYVPRSELTAHLACVLKPRDVLVTMGAGDITQVGPEVLRCLE